MYSQAETYSQTSLRVQLSRFVFGELTTTLTGRHTAVQRWSSRYTSYSEYTGRIEGIYFSTGSTRSMRRILTA